MTDFSRSQLNAYELVHHKLRLRGNVQIIMKLDRLMDTPFEKRNETLTAITTEVHSIPRNKAQ